MLAGVVTATLISCDNRTNDAHGLRYVVDIVDIREHAEGTATLGEPSLRQLLRDGLQRSASFVAADGIAAQRSPTSTGLNGEFWYASRLDHQGGRKLLVHLRIDAPPELTSALRGQDLEATRVIESPPLEHTAPLSDDLELAIERTVAVLDAMVSLSRVDNPRILELLRGNDPELVALALEWVRDHRPPGFAEIVVDLLAHPEDRVALLAVETLGRVGSSAHAGALVQSVRLQDRGHALRVYEALSRLGGPQAEGFLQFAVRNEDDSELGAAAQRALESLVFDRGVAGTTLPTRPSLRGHRQ